MNDYVVILEQTITQKFEVYLQAESAEQAKELVKKNPSEYITNESSISGDSYELLNSETIDFKIIEVELNE